MILVDGDKYACEQCIRGHRSSQCQHIKRPLVLVRSRGRPATDSSKRIAIMGELLLPPDSPHDSREHSGCPQSRNPENSVIVLKANKRQVFNVSRKSLKLLDPVIEVPSKQAGLDLISTRSHGRGKCRSKRAKLQPEQEPVTYDMFLTESCTQSRRVAGPTQSHVRRGGGAVGAGQLQRRQLRRGVLLCSRRLRLLQLRKARDRERPEGGPTGSRSQLPE
ncbi:hypothetical protein KL930_001550 [Ogataea haglerorum]|uniref:uncharacterized protein n=1 Tax=Ogataea haglerorum TaxID=1937702 RepID=UPI001C896330|nr:uncharacterized protein KL911_004396 [Ogataea haglerorum]KAG7698772.1 hypothetical protein KL951_002036 [Ogataea haglerorum]KAG7746122.1 hypothetical protein KL912_004683 [Ogataea haglerorum]KAG7751818.1 hypothetical protein KL911_004396 [Ogataea haglerorum]KAG7780625.1 hypothetical protein KL922_000976 [Ogataea haglerorum]KAG7782054.1 hypothetical protein KL930_001550 [Ogataea haglerorum]